jgi:hypothetical protein
VQAVDSITIAQSDKVAIIRAGDSIRLVDGESQREPTNTELALIEIINTLVRIKLPIRVDLDNGRRRSRNGR